MTTEAGKRKFKLIRRRAPNVATNQELIQKNLAPLLEYTEKKRHAQELYYNNHLGLSPLKRDGQGPVKLRLGNKKANLPYGTNTASIGPKPRSLRRFGNIPVEKQNKIYSVQQRLQKIRQNQNVNGKRLRKPFTKTVPSTVLTKPHNLRIQVNNPLFAENVSRIHQKKFKMILNARLQTEIKTLQSVGQSEIHHLDNFRPMPVMTPLNMHSRFSNL